MHDQTMSSESHGQAEKQHKWKQRLFSKDTTRFKTYIGSTSVNGLIPIFNSKSYIRRIFWLVIVLGATGGCLYNISDRIIFLASKPTSTTVSIERKGVMDFPAVTICNLNRFRKSVVSQIDGLEEVVREVFYISRDMEQCENLTRLVAPLIDGVSLIDLTYEARHRLEEFILLCRYQGRDCNLTRDFIPILTRLGVCYMFNAGPVISEEPIKTINGTGTRNSLRLALNVSQDDYVATTDFDAGVKVAIHTQAEPPQPDDQGIGIPVGMNGFISVKEQIIVDETQRNCRPTDDIADLNFLREEYNYSISACIEDCFYTEVADKCGCLGAKELYAPDVERFRSLPSCTFDDFCCEISQTIYPQSTCTCNTACTSTTYMVTNSYSLFPATYAVEDLGIPLDVISHNFLTVSIYFETLNVERETTVSAYTPVALLSDIGGQMGLFLGISVITVLEFATWIFDEVKDRVFGISEDNIAKKCCSCCKRRKEAVNELSLEKTAKGNENGSEEETHEP